MRPTDKHLDRQIRGTNKFREESEVKTDKYERYLFKENTKKEVEELLAEQYDERIAINIRKKINQTMTVQLL